MHTLAKTAPAYFPLEAKKNTWSLSPEIWAKLEKNRLGVMCIARRYRLYWWYCSSFWCRNQFFSGSSHSFSNNYFPGACTCTCSNKINYLPEYRSCYYRCACTHILN